MASAAGPVDHGHQPGLEASGTRNTLFGNRFYGVSNARVDD